MIYQPLNCHSYNQINISGKKIKVATIDTMLSFYLAFIYANRDYYDVNRILCMSKYLFQVQQHNRLAQKGLLKRFSIECYGDVISFDEMRLEKSRQFKELKNKPNSKQYESLFLKYRPEDEKKRKNKNVNKKTKKNKVIKNKTRKNKNILSGIFKIKI